ncbi:MAG: Tol-Pal system beta propeller repeat protein TolB [Nitrospiraceae bacterium]|nr:Tol-Pal system beta propeller repeat protein TolB [Nitrospiraceae bacterium]
MTYPNTALSIEHSTGHGRSAGIFLLLILLLAPSLSSAKIYIDITSPSIKKMPVAVFDLQGPQGAEISDVIRDDLTFTGLFMCVDKSSYTETASQPFSQANWLPLGVEAVVKGTISGDRNFSASVKLYDTADGREIMNKQYQAERSLLRQIGHTIANDIYQALTGGQGIFRTRILFVGEDGGEKGMYMMDWDGQRLRKLGLKGSLMLTPHWASDGTKIIYSSERGRQWGIYLLDFLKLTEKKVFSAKGINMAGDFFPDGNSFVFSSSKDGTPNIYSYQLGSGTVRKITSTRGIDVSPAVSPDGKSIAFISDRGGSPQVYVMGTDGQELRRLTFEGSYNTSPSWSPLGDRIVFSGRKNGRNQIFTIAPDGTQLTQLTDQGNNEDPSFSPDGRYISFTSDRERIKAIFIMRANGEAQKRITPRSLKAFGPRWSPN